MKSFFKSKLFKRFLMIFLLLLIIYNSSQKEGVVGAVSGAATGVAQGMATPSGDAAKAIADTIKELIITGTYDMIENVQSETAGAMENLAESAAGGGDFANALKKSPVITALTS